MLDALGQPADKSLGEYPRSQLYQLQILDAGEADLEVAEERV